MINRRSQRLKKFYLCWINMIRRCRNKNNPVYKYYGGRGIKVCYEWLNFENFMSDLFEDYEENVLIRGYKNTTLDRINNNGNYELNNVKWSSYKEQSENRRTKIVNGKYTKI